MNKLFLNNTELLKEGLSDKKIYRKKHNDKNKIVIDFSNYPKDFENFLNIYKILKKINISIPTIYEIHFKKKVIIMEDFGEMSFDKILNEENLYSLIKLGVDNLLILNNSLIYEDFKNLKKYSYNDLKKEISEFIDYYIPYRGISNFPVKKFYEIWQKIYHEQQFEFNSFVHKDFEFINLLYLNKEYYHLKCGIIDFQSAFIGFVGWDLFSFLENPRLNFTRKYNEEMMRYFFDNISTNIDYNIFKSQYYILNLSRQTRLLGRWIKLFNSTSKKEYLLNTKCTQNRLIKCLENIQNDELYSIYKDSLVYE